MNSITTTLQYGALGLLGVVIAGFFWYMRSIEARAAKREEKEQSRQDKYLDALVKSTATLAILIGKYKEHEQRMTEEHKQLQIEHKNIVAACRKFSQRGIGE